MKRILSISIAILLIGFSLQAQQECFDKNAVAFAIPLPGLTATGHNINTGDLESITVVKGGVYLFDNTSSFVSQMALYSELVPGIAYTNKWKQDDNKTWQSDFDGVLWFAIRDKAVLSENGIAYTCGFRRTSASLSIRQTTGNITFPSQPQNTTATCGETVFFSASVQIGGSSNATFAHQWEVSTNNGVSYSEVSGATSTSLNLANITETAFTSRYRLRSTVGNEVGYSNHATITKKSVDPPSGLDASQDNCEGKVIVSWEWYLANPEKWWVQYSSNNGSSWVDLDANLSGTRRKIEHTGVTRGTNYRYRVATFSKVCAEFGAFSTDIVTGVSPGSPTAPRGLSVAEVAVSGGKGVRVNWIDNSSDELGFLIARSHNDGSNRVDFRYESNGAELAGTGARTYTDSRIENCQPYKYTVYAYNKCYPEGIIALDAVTSVEDSKAIVVETTIVDVLSPANLNASKGYYSDRTILNWSINANSNYAFADRLKVYGREYGSNVAPQLLSILNSDFRQYTDESGKAGTLYEYFVVAVGDCGDGEIASFDINSVPNLTNLPTALNGSGVAYSLGFRSPSGTVNGNIFYQGGIAVPNVKVVVEREEGNAGTALSLDGVDDRLEVPNSNTLQFNSGFTASLWVKPTQIAAGNRTILHKNNFLKLTQNGTSLSVNIGVANAVSVSVPNVFEANQYKNLTVTYDESILTVYVTGRQVYKNTHPYNIESTTGKLVFGATNVPSEHFAGRIDEIRFHTNVMDSLTVAKDNGRLIIPSRTGLAAYWRLNEGVSPYFFDLSNNGGSFNQNNGEIFGATWSTDIPDGRQLGTSGYTDKNGNYTVSGVAYNGTGENFTVTPSITLGGAVHQFTPAQKVLFIGEGTSVQNSIDFTDVSSFRVTGHVRYDFGDKTVGVNEVRFLLDGQTYIQNGTSFVETNADGFFDIQVPVGLHSIQAQLGFHEFVNDGKWPTLTEKYDFQEPVSGLLIYDKTLRTIRGRVVGGLVEANKVVGWNKSTNNIGTASFVIAESNGKPISATITTDPNSGEFITELPPLRYTVRHPTKKDGGGASLRGIAIAGNNPASLYFEQASLVEQMTLDLTKANTLKYEIDSTLIAPNQYDVDSAAYHYMAKLIYRSTPSVNVYDGSNTKADVPFLGDKFFVYQNKDGSKDSVDLRAGFADPVLLQGANYQLRIAVTENYVRNDAGAPINSTAPVSDAKLSLTNFWGKGFYQDENGDIGYYTKVTDEPGVVPDTLKLAAADGDTTYTFKATTPEFNNNVSFATQSFTKSFQLTVLTPGNAPVYWPEAANVNTVKNAYVLGSKPLSGTSFVTQGPDMVDFILRDPPGDGSFTYLTQGTTTSRTSSFSFAGGQDVNFELGIGVGVTTWVGFGAGVINEADAQATVGLDLSYKLGESGERVTSYTATQTIQTAEGQTGPDYDLFVGKSENVTFGLSQTLSLVKATDCGNGIIKCTGSNINGKNGVYRLGSAVASWMNPTGEATVFAYTASFIEGTLIPNIKKLRNNVLVRNNRYASQLGGTHENYGKNNDDPVFGAGVSTGTPLITEPEDFIGLSYRFTPSNNSELDSVRWLNQQVRLWEKQLSVNEKEKVALIQKNNPKRNISYSGGSSLSFEETSTETQTESFTYEFSQGASIGTSFDISLFGFSSELKASTSVTFEQGGVETTSAESSTTYGYTISDQNPEDYFNVKVFDSEQKNGPVFQIADGGVTQCPHEPEVLTKYYQKGTKIGERTFQRDKPRVEADVPIMYNVPADQSANFILTIYNDSEDQSSMEYELAVLDETNPNGLKVTMDGVNLSGSRKVTVAGGAAIQKVLEVERGPFEYDYKDFKVRISSICENTVIGDTIALTAYYLPACTTPTILSPKDQWVLNSNLQDTLNILVGGFNINYVGFESVTMEYKLSSQSQWSAIETFHRDTTGLNDKKAKQIPRTNPIIDYDWVMRDLDDGNYDLRAVSKCKILTSGSHVYGESEIFSGLADRINPHPFGTPQPGDGILAAGKDISIQFNEPINAGLLRPVNFEVTGVLNGGTVRNSASMEFAGVANHYMEIPEGIEFNKKSFSIDFNLSRKQFGEQIILSQGAAEADALEIGFDATDRIYFRIGNKKLTSQARILDSRWTHYAFVYNHETGVGSISINATTHPDDIDNDFLVDYVELGKITIGKARYNTSKLLNARMHELRIWNRALSESSVGIVATKRLNRTEFGLVGNWKMEEGEGEIAFDHIRSKNARIFGNWTIEPSGFAYSLTGNSYLTAKSIAYTAENNFTIEFWFKRAANTDSVTLISNGIGDGRDVNKTGWAIGADTEGKLYIANNGEKFKATSKSYFDDVWHHMAISVNRITSTNVYIDGKQVSSHNPEKWVGFGGSKIWIGARGWFEGAIERNDQYFGGQFDDVRVWALAKNAEQINLQRKNKLQGNEIGLDAYYSFETFIEDSGVLVKSFTMDNQSTKPSADDVLQLNGTGSGGQTDNTPTINLPRPVRQLSFTYTANGDKIIISPTEPEYLMEGVILNIVVRDVVDLNGNKLQSPVSWTAFYNKNTVLWGDASKNLTLELGNTTSFQTTVVNAGGRVENWSISNIPDWLKVSPSSGTLDPLTTQTITVSVPEGVNLGKYSQDLFLISDYGYNEPFLVDLKVFQSPPSNWKVTETDFEYSMSVVGKLLIGGRVSQNPDDIVAAFVGDECRGLVNMRYIDLYDQHFAFLNIFSNKVSGEEIELRVWDAANGRVYTDVTPQISFISESRIGRASAPVNIETVGLVQLERPVVKGWQWLSFNINSAKMLTVKDFMAKFGNSAAGDIIKSQTHFDTYDPANNWIGTITNNGGFKNDIMYKFKLSNPGIIQVSGVEVDPSLVTINIQPGWNWISFTSQRNLDINTALSNYNASIGDEVKTQRGFAVYEGPMIGWVGSLTFLNYGSGIMLKSTKTTSFKFPSVPLNSRVKFTEDVQIKNVLEQIGITQYESNMTLVAKSESVFENGNMLKVFNGEIPVGYAYNHEVNGESYLFITVYGNKSNTMLDLMDDQGVSYHVENFEVFTFTPDATFGTLDKPVNILSNSASLEEFEKSISIFPNPFESIIELRTTSEFGTLAYELFDVSGRLIESKNLPAVHSTVGVAIKPDVKKGLYLLKVYGDGNLLRTVKLIKE